MAEDINNINNSSKEIVIKLNKCHMKKAGYVFLIIALITVIICQHYGAIPVRSDINISEKEPIKEGSDIIGPIEEESETIENNEESAPEIETIEQEETKNTAETTSDEGLTEEQQEDEEEPVASSEETLLDITGDVSITIDDIKIDPKPNIEDYAKITSVKFTIKNQDKDFTPTIKAHLTGDIDDIKDVDLEKLKAGYSITKTSTDLFFGYNDVDEQKTLKIELYNENKKMIASATKSFTTD